MIEAKGEVSGGIRVAGNGKGETEKGERNGWKERNAVLEQGKGKTLCFAGFWLHSTECKEPRA